jgi:hypothetical protein
MIGGGYIRRQSMNSVFEASPCARIEKRKPATLRASLQGIALAQRFAALLREEDEDSEAASSSVSHSEGEAEPESQDSVAMTTQEESLAVEEVEVEHEYLAEPPEEPLAEPALPPRIEITEEKHDEDFVQQGPVPVQKVEPTQQPKIQLPAQPSIASPSPSKFGEDRMGQAYRGILNRQSLEMDCLSAEGQDGLLSG